MLAQKDGREASAKASPALSAPRTGQGTQRLYAHRSTIARKSSVPASPSAISATVAAVVFATLFVATDVATRALASHLPIGLMWFAILLVLALAIMTLLVVWS